ncbi:MAG: beta-N-acetylhexosaminidase [Gemmatimonadetes bacterium]|nr:beta-N-acetylhexosaminidase [Gemmatimonadota bacterium]
MVSRCAAARVAMLCAAVALSACTHTAVIAASPAPVTSVAASTQLLTDAQWVDSALASLSPRDRAAQLVMPWMLADYVPTGTAEWGKLSRLVTEQRVGGMIVSVGSPTDMALKLNALQRLSTLPLLVGADFETGAGFRARAGYFVPNAIDLGGATLFPYEMGVGATRDTALAYEMGRVTALEGRALGVHLAFSPILDVNNNPGNPVIGARSFGENPQLVASLGAAFVRGIQEHGMLATAKHFPGHGDTDENSHLQLTHVTASRARLDTVELVPFRAAIAAGVGGIMTFHGVVPALDSSGVPATLSPKVMTELLRTQLGFKGLLVTDAMDMNGVLDRVQVATPSPTVMGTYGPIHSIGIAEAIKLAVEAGADILLMPSDVPAAIDAVVEGVREGRFTQARVDASVRRILELKARFRLRQQRFVSLDSVRAIVGDSSHLSSARIVAQRAITLVRDSLATVPLARGTPARRVLSLTIANRSDLGAGVAFDAELRRAHPGLRSLLVGPENAGPLTARALEAADSADVVIVSSYLAQSTTASTGNAPVAVVQLLHALAKRRPNVVLVAFGNPYFLQQLPEVPAYLVAWGGWPVNQVAAARALTGSAPITGLLPITIPPMAVYGQGLVRR